MVIAHNLKAMNADRKMNIVISDKAKSMEKLSSGYKVNRAGDDAAGLSISEKMRFQIRGLDRGSANIEEGIGYCQVADGALSEMHDMLQRMNELCIQAANGTLSNTDRGYVDDEVQQLKLEIDRICRTTKFNDEYIFRCEDVIPGDTHEVYMLSFQGRPKDLFIYNTSYDPDTYAGVAFRGRRYTWDEINPNMYDPVTKKFHEGRYSFRADDGTMLTLVCEKDAELPQVSRLFTTSADGRGIYVNDDLVGWDSGKWVGDSFQFDYHGMTISFRKDQGDTFEDMMLKMTGTVWESKYETPVASKALDANFGFSEYSFKNNDRVAGWIDGKRTKYILHAVDGNRGGTIPDANGNLIPFDGVWLEGTDDNWNPTGKSLYSMTWEQFGFACKDFTYVDTSTVHPPYCDWGNMSTDIWVGGIKDDPKKPYPPDPDSINKNNFANYDPYNEFSTVVQEVNNSESVSFVFSVINEISKEIAVGALNMGIGYGLLKTSDVPKVQVGGNVKGGGGTLNLSIDDEYLLGRDYENGSPQFTLTGYEGLTYKNGTFSVTYGYARGGGSMTLSGGASSNSSMASIQDRIIQGGYVSGNKISANNTSQGISVYLSGGNGSSLNLSFNYDISGFFSGGGATVRETPGNTYVKINNRYVPYRPWDPSHKNLTPCNVTITGAGGRTLEQYFNEVVYPDIARNAKVQLEATDYPKSTLRADENPNSAMVTRYQTPFQHDPSPPAEEPKEKPEYLRIQCSSNTIDNIYIQKQKLSVYRLGLLNVGTLSELQATGCIDTVGNAIFKVSSIRSLFGAEQNRLEHAYDANRNAHENTQRAESMIRDTDMAKEMVQFSNKSILEQSGMSMLAQANQSNQGVMTLLQ